MGNPIRQVFDGLRNVLTGMGVAGKDPSLSTLPQRADGAILQAYQLWDLFRTEPYARRTVELPEQHATRRGWSSTFGDNEKLTADVAAENKRLKTRKAYRLASKYCAIEGAATVVFVSPDEDQSLPMLRPKSIEGVRVYRGMELYPKPGGELDAEGQPLLYVRPVSAKGAGVEIHASRVIAFTGLRVPDEFKHSTPTLGLWPYDSRLSAAWPAIRSLTTGEASAERALHQLRVAKLGLPIAAIQEAGNEAALFKRLDTLQQGVSSFQTFLYETQPVGGQALESLEFDTLDLRGVVDILRHFIGKAAGDMPVTLFAGSAPGGMSTDDASGSRNWDAFIRAHQTDDYQPAIERGDEIIAATLGNAGAEFDVEFNPLHDPTSKEKAETEKLEAETDALYWERDGLEDPRDRVDTVVVVRPPVEQPAE